MSKSREQVVSEILFEIGQLDQLLVIYADLLQRVQERDPDTVEIAAVATVLHSFYNGVENIFFTVAKGIDESVPSGGQSHRDLILQVSRKTNQREQVIPKQTAQSLSEYLGFRHFYRHSYSFLIDWQELKKLVVPLEEVWRNVKSELLMFIETLAPTQM